MYKNHKCWSKPVEKSYSLFLGLHLPCSTLFYILGCPWELYRNLHENQGVYWRRMLTNTNSEFSTFGDGVQESRNHLQLIRMAIKVYLDFVLLLSLLMSYTL